MGFQALIRPLGLARFFLLSVANPLQLGHLMIVLQL
jgi:hypothetical protein